MSDTKVKKPPVLFKETQKLITDLEKKLQMPFITYWNSAMGSVCDNDVLAIYEVMEQLGKNEQIALFIKSYGGNGQAALRIVNLLRHYNQKITALTPLECASAATMIALGADDIKMGPLSHLTAVDTSLTHDLSPLNKENQRVSVSQDELKRIVNLWRKEAKQQDKNPYEPLFQYIHPLVIGAIDRSESLSIKLCQEILSYHIDNIDLIDKISKDLNAKYPSHNYPITLKEAQKIGLQAQPLENDINSLLLDLNALYSEMGQDAITDYDEHNYHNNAILNIMEGKYIQVYYQLDQDSHYIKEEQRWITINSKNGWNKIQYVKGKFEHSVLHIR